MSDIPAPDLEGFEPILQEGFLGHVGGFMLKRVPERTGTCVLVAPQHLNPNGTAHGGLLMTLLDITLGAAVESHLGASEAGHPTTVQVSCSLMGPALGGHWLFGDAEVDASTRTMTFVSGRLHSDGRTVLTASAVFRNPPARGSPRDESRFVTKLQLDGIWRRLHAGRSVPHRGTARGSCLATVYGGRQ